VADDDVQGLLAVPLIGIQGLAEELEISDPTLHKYLNKLSIERIKDGKRAYISQADYEKVAALASMLRKGKFDSVADAIRELRSRGVIIPKRPEELELDGEDERAEVERFQPVNWSFIERLFPSFLALGETIVSPLANAINQLGEVLKPAPPSAAAKQREIREYLDDAASRGWKLATSELAPLLGLKPSAISGSPFERIGYRFIKVGKSGRESLWKVEKLA
jgi:DNA-binding Lrp family transcriptional regulator